MTYVPTPKPGTRLLVAFEATVSDIVSTDEDFLIVRDQAGYNHKLYPQSPVDLFTVTERSWAEGDLVQAADGSVFERTAPGISGFVWKTPGHSRHFWDDGALARPLTKLGPVD